jgi:hypothetical protein
MKMESTGTKAKGVREVARARHRGASKTYCMHCPNEVEDSRTSRPVGLSVIVVDIQIKGTSL